MSRTVEKLILLKPIKHLLIVNYPKKSNEHHRKATIMKSKAT